MASVREGPVLTSEFEAIARAVERETEGVLVELIDGRLGVKALPDGNHGEILNWLLLTSMPLGPAMFLHIARMGLRVGADRSDRVRPDGVLAPLNAFRGSGEWAPPDAVVMTVDITSSDSDADQRIRVEKPTVYAQTGISIYLLIDRDAAEMVVHCEPGGSSYQEVHRYAVGRSVTLPNPVGVTLDTTPLKDWIG